MSLLQHHGSKASVLQCSAFFIVQLSHPYMTTGKTIALTRWTFVGKVMSLLFNILSRLVITFLPRSKCLLISWLQSPSAVILGFPCGSAGKESVCNEGNLGSIPGLGRSPGEGKGYPLQYCGLENSMDCTVHGVAKSRTLLSDFQLSLSLSVIKLGFPGGSDSKESSCNVGDPNSIPELGRSPGEGNGYPLHQYSCLENSMN